MFFRDFFFWLYIFEHCRKKYYSIQIIQYIIQIIQYLEFQTKVEFFPVGSNVEILKGQRILKSPDTNNTRKLKGQEGDGEEMMISESWNCGGHRAVKVREILWNILLTARDSMLMQEQNAL